MLPTVVCLGIVFVVVKFWLWLWVRKGFGGFTGGMEVEVAGDNTYDLVRVEGDLPCVLLYHVADCCEFVGVNVVVVDVVEVVDSVGIGDSSTNGASN